MTAILLTILLVLLKQTGIISWAYVWVLLPIWIFAAGILCNVAIVIIGEYKIMKRKEKLTKQTSRWR